MTEKKRVLHLTERQDRKLRNEAHEVRRQFEVFEQIGLFDVARAVIEDAREGGIQSHATLQVAGGDSRLLKAAFADHEELGLAVFTSSGVDDWIENKFARKHPSVRLLLDFSLESPQRGVDGDRLTMSFQQKPKVEKRVIVPETVVTSAELQIQLYQVKNGTLDMGAIDKKIYPFKDLLPFPYTDTENYGDATIDDSGQTDPYELPLGKIVRELITLPPAK